MGKSSRTKKIKKTKVAAEAGKSVETGKSVEEVEAGKSVEAEKVPKIKKRKRDDVTCTQETPIPTVQKRKKESKPLNGLILAVSTLDVKNEKHSSSDSSYQAVAALCTELGAKITGQVHKKVFAVICNQSAVTQLTQRVRKAVKKKHALLIDVEWVRQCKIQYSRVDYEEYLLTELAETNIENRNNKIKSKEKSKFDGHQKSGDNGDVEEKLILPDAGWTEPIALDCCCVCHETDRDDCKWCVDCNVTLARKARQLLSK